MTTIADPKAPRAPRPGPGRRVTRGNLELASWVFMRVSGVVLVILIFGHLFVNLVAGGGVKAIDFAFVAGKWADLRWRVWDLLMLWLAMVHGTNGLRTIINDYAEKSATRLWLKVLLAASAILVVVLGTLVIFTFDPCPVGAAAGTLPSFCPAP
ncbi:MAG: succinate dehydrogenase hydrophobic membrane anchor subunit [Actinobacteria bacterium]|nr:succinate dehydrogenase hydrophobic membrane anchor subunit [Actinomycetota bacterium]MCG2800520.1 succinate dehydrogenase hydrophobic membrane anchor subunit [Cellulomonas sp.]